MKLPLYQSGETPKVLPEHGHAGLWWDKFFDGFLEDWTVDKTGKVLWIGTVTGLRGRKSDLARFAQRNYELGQALNAHSKVFCTDWNFVTGLGLPHPVENGFTWHPTLGVPYLPASGIKGLLRAWVEAWQDFATEAEREAKIRAWFGSNEKDHEKAGDLIFFDAIPVDCVELSADIMTPHMGKWYEKGAQIMDPVRDARSVPADWHSPIPIAFLVVKKAGFLFQIAARSRAQSGVTQSDVKEAMDWLQDALGLLGAGAKTAAGYGRMREDAVALEQLQQARHVSQRQAEEAARQSHLSPLEREIEAVLAAKTDVNVADSVALLQAIERWQGADKKAVAWRIKEMMINAKTWRPDSNKPDKDKDHKRTLQVQGILDTQE